MTKLDEIKKAWEDLRYWGYDEVLPIEHCKLIFEDLPKLLNGEFVKDIEDDEILKMNDKDLKTTAIGLRAENKHMKIKLEAQELFFKYSPLFSNADQKKVRDLCDKQINKVAWTPDEVMFFLNNKAPNIELLRKREEEAQADRNRLVRLGNLRIKK